MACGRCGVSVEMERFMGLVSGMGCEGQGHRERGERAGAAGTLLDRSAPMGGGFRVRDGVKEGQERNG